MAKDLMSRNNPRINLELMPESVREEHCRVLLSSIREFFGNMTPAQKEAYERWSEEYDRKHGLSSNPM